jgi:putative addiction module killer protein
LRLGNTYVTLTHMMEIRYYAGAGGNEPFADWFADLEPVARAKITRAIARLEQGNFSNVKSVGEGVLEYRIDFGPGYRVYFGRDGEILVVLLTGGSKKRQQREIDAARTYWLDYKRRKRAALRG